MTDDEVEIDEEPHARRDADHLRLLAVLACIYSVVALFGLIELLWRGLGAAAMRSPTAFIEVVRSVAAAALAPSTAWLMATRRARTLCVAAAFVVAWDWPAGTVFGVAALVVLARESVADAFEDAAAARRARTTDAAATIRALRARRRARRRRAATAEAETSPSSPHDTP